MSLPEDSMLRRHYLTELRSQQDKAFQAFQDATRPKLQTIVYAQPFWSNGVLIPAIAFFFFLALLIL